MLESANGDGRADLVLGGAAGRQAEVKVMAGGTLATVRDTMAFDPSFLGGVFVG